MSMSSTTGMTELEIEREGYRYMVGLFSIALIAAVIFCVHFYDNQKEKANVSIMEAYTVGWQQGYLRAIQATNDAVVRKDTIALSEFEKVMAIDIKEFKRLNSKD